MMDRLWNPGFEASTLTQPDQGNIDMRYPNGTPHGDRYAPFNADQRPSRTYQNSAEQEEDTGKQTQRRRITVAVSTATT